MADLLSREYEVNYSHIDNRGIAKPSFLWNIMQDAATVHAEELHLGPAELHILWVLSRMKVRLSRPLRPYERIRCETWCPGIRGVSWYRCFAFYAGEEPVGDAQSMWVTLDPETHRILAPEQLPRIRGLPAHRAWRAVRPAAQAVVRNRARAHVHPVLYSDLDVNNHVNNVRVVELVSDALDLQRQPGFVSSLQVNYTAETGVRRAAFPALRHGGRRALCAR